MDTNTQARINAVAGDLQLSIAEAKRLAEGAKKLTDRLILSQRQLNELTSDIEQDELAEKLAKAEAAEVERFKLKQAQGDPNVPLMERLFPKSQPVPMPTYPTSPTVTVTRTNPAQSAAPARPKNLTNEARALIQTGHSYERAVRKLQEKYPNHPADHVRRAVGRARDGR